MRTSRPLLIVLLLLTLTPLVRHLAAQERPESERMAQYKLDRREEWAAAGLEALLPLLGHAYVEDYRRGVRPALVSGAGLAIWAVGVASVEPSVWALGSLVYFGGRGWGIVSALHYAREYNAALREELDLSVRPTPAGLEVAVTVPVGF